jgi:hypothetical protein
LSDNVPTNRRRDPFRPDELQTLLGTLTLGMSHHLYWLTWVALYTGAKPNELLQLTREHVRRFDDIDYLYFSPELRLKTGEDELVHPQ